MLFYFFFFPTGSKKKKTSNARTEREKERANVQRAASVTVRRFGDGKAGCGVLGCPFRRAVGDWSTDRSGCREVVAESRLINAAVIARASAYVLRCYHVDCRPAYYYGVVNVVVVIRRFSR